MIFVGGLLPGEASGVTGVTQKVMASILEAPTAAAEMKVPMSVSEAINVEKEKELLTAVADIEKETEPYPVPISKAVVTESAGEPLAPVPKTMVIGQ